MFRLESAVPDRFGSQTTATSVFSFTFVCCCCSLFFVLVGFFPIHFQLVLMNARHIRHNQLPNSTDCVRDIFSLFSKWRVTEFMLNKYFPCRPLHNSFISITVSCKLSQKDAGRMTFFLGWVSYTFFINITHTRTMENRSIVFWATLWEQIPNANYPLSSNWTQNNNANSLFAWTIFVFNTPFR